jgi:hypothetical protein
MIDGPKTSSTELHWEAGALLARGDEAGAAALTRLAEQAEAEEELGRLGITPGDAKERQRREEAEQIKRGNALAAQGIIPEPRDVIELHPLSSAGPASVSTTQRDHARNPFLNWSDFWQRERDERAWVLEPILARGRGHALYAPQKLGKSLLMLWASLQIIRAADPAIVIYLDYEMTEDDLYDRLTDMGCGSDTDLSRFRYALLPTLPPLDTPEGASELLDIVDTEQAAFPDYHIVVAIDTTSRAVAGKENDADTFRDFYRHTGFGLKQRGVTWARLDHAGKDGSRGQRGSSAKGDDVDVIWRVEATDDGLQLRRDAARMGWVPERVPLHRHDEPLRYSVTAAAWPAGTKELADELNALGLPWDATVRACREVLNGSGRPARNNVLSAAVRYRKQTHEEGESGW